MAGGDVFSTPVVIVSGIENSLIELAAIQAGMAEIVVDPLSWECSRAAAANSSLRDKGWRLMMDARWMRVDQVDNFRLEVSKDRK